MLRTFLRGTLAATMCLTGALVIADEPGDKKKEKKEAKVEARVLTMSKKVTVGPDGKIQIEEIGGDSSKLPKKALEALKKAGINIMHVTESDGKKIRVIANANEIADGIKLGGEMSGKIVIIGDDGFEKIHEFGSKLPMNGDAIAKKVREAMKKHMKAEGDAEIAVESAMEQVKKALSDIDGKINVQIRTAFDDLPKGDDEEIIIIKEDMKVETDEDEDDDDEMESKVLSKLDLILKRLEKLEAEVDALKEKDLI